MNRVFFRAEELPLPSWTSAAEKFVKKVLDKLGRKNCEVSVLFCDNSYIKSLNAEYLGEDNPTDILSFPQGDLTDRQGQPPEGNLLAGDIVISLQALGENARFFRVCEDEELRRLLVHGILHLLGADHATNNPQEPMLLLQEKILTALADERIQENV